MKVLFVCLGNICRSPMAEAIFKKKLVENHMDSWVSIDSAGLDNYHEGELADARMRAHASRRGYEITHRSRPVVASDFEAFDLILGMDHTNMRGLRSRQAMYKGEAEVLYMTAFAENRLEDEVPDPYYGGDAGFEHVIDLLEDACEGLIKHLQQIRK